MNFISQPERKGTKFKIHWANLDGRPLCGGGRGGKSVMAWQEDIGPLSCMRCAKIGKSRGLFRVDGAKTTMLV